jgi:hypothetical protein
MIIYFFLQYVATYIKVNKYACMKNPVEEVHDTFKNLNILHAFRKD